jgi:hypothetical protein
MPYSAAVQQMCGRVASAAAIPALATLLLAAGTTEVQAQRGNADPRAKPLELQQPLRIDLAREEVILGAMAVAPDGRIIMAPARGRGARTPIKAFDSTGRRLPWTIPTGRGDSVEISSVSRLGFMGTTLYVVDQGFDHFALVSNQGVVTKSIELPSLVRPTWADRRRFPIFESLEPIALYPDGSMLVYPLSPRSVLATPDFDSTTSYLMRVNASGAIQQVVARTPRETAPGFQMLPGVERFVVPRLWAVAANGSRIAVVAAPQNGRDSTTITVTMLNDRGDTMFVRRLEHAPVRVTQAQVDSAIARGGVSAERIGTVARGRGRLVVGQQIPATLPPVTAIVIGRDQSVWLALAETREGQPYVGWDSRGDPLGTFTAPRTMRLTVADRTTGWFVERSIPTSPGAVVRYRIVPRGTAGTSRGRGGIQG